MPPWSPWWDRGDRAYREALCSCNDVAVVSLGETGKSWREINRPSSARLVQAVKHGLDGEINFTNPPAKKARLETLRVQPLDEDLLARGLRDRCSRMERVSRGLNPCLPFDRN